MSQIKHITLPDGNTYDIGAGINSNLNDLTDVNISSPTNGQVLAYNGTTQKWVNIAIDSTPTQNSSNPVTSGGVYSALSSMPVWTSGVQALTSATSCTITDSAISSTSVLEVFFENTSNTDPVAKVTGVSSHTATIEFSALAENTTFYLRVTNL